MQLIMISCLIPNFFTMDKAYSIPCPNCGASAVRRYFVSQDNLYNSCPDNQVTTTECSTCDYLMTMCTLNGRVVEASGCQPSALQYKSLRNVVSEIPKISQAQSA